MNHFCVVVLILKFYNFFHFNFVSFLFFFPTQVKGQHHDFLVEDKARADERKEIIDVVQDMIEHHDQLFQVVGSALIITFLHHPGVILIL